MSELQKYYEEQSLYLRALLARPVASGPIDIQSLVQLEPELENLKDATAKFREKLFSLAPTEAERTSVLGFLSVVFNVIATVQQRVSETNYEKTNPSRLRII